MRRKLGLSLDRLTVVVVLTTHFSAAACSRMAIIHLFSDRPEASASALHSISRPRGALQVMETSLEGTVL